MFKLQSHFHSDWLVRVIFNQFQMGHVKLVDGRSGRGVDYQRGERFRGPCELLLQALNMVLVNVRVPDDVHKLCRFQPTRPRNKACQERVGRNVKRYSQAHVGAPLVHLAGQLAVGNVELAQHMARW